MNRTAVRAVYEAKTLLAPYRLVALPAARVRARTGHGEPVDRGTDLVIEGYPRSANNFALAAFRSAQSRAVRVAHHTHAPATVTAAVRWGVPVLLLIREPEDAVLEFVIRKPALSVPQALRGYVRFYRPLLPVRDRVVVASFEQVTSDLGAVTLRVNERYGTRFVEFDHSPDNVASCFREIEDHYRTRYGTEDLERVVARPSEERDRIKESLRRSYRSAPDRLRHRAGSLYAAFSRAAREDRGAREPGSVAR